MKILILIMFCAASLACRLDYESNRSNTMKELRNHVEQMKKTTKKKQDDKDKAHMILAKMEKLPQRILIDVKSGMEFHYKRPLSIAYNNEKNIYSISLNNEIWTFKIIKTPSEQIKWQIRGITGGLKRLSLYLIIKQPKKANTKTEKPKAKPAMVK